MIKQTLPNRYAALIRDSEIAPTLAGGMTVLAFYFFFTRQNSALLQHRPDISMLQAKATVSYESSISKYAKVLSKKLCVYY